MTSPNRPIRHRGRSYDSIGTMTVRGRRFFLLERVARVPRQRFLAFDPTGRGQLRMIAVLPLGDHASQFLRVLKRVPGHNQIPNLVCYERGSRELTVVVNWLPGISLEEYFSQVMKHRTPRPTVVHSVRLFRGLLHGLLHLHRYAEIVHADIKPENLIMTRRPSMLRMIDFGSAWPTEKTGFRADGDGVTRVYGAPELFHRDAQVDWRADQFSASVVFYRLLTMKCPYDGIGGEAARDADRHAMSRALVPPSRYFSGARLPRKLNKQIDTLVTAGLQLDAADRYETPRAWIDAVDRAYFAVQTHRHATRVTPAVWDKICYWVGNRLGPRDQNRKR